MSAIPAIDQLINGTRYDYSSIKLCVLTPAPVFITNINSISYEYSREIGVLRGTSSKKQGRTRGVFDATGSMSLYVEEWNKLVAALKLSPFPSPTAGFMEKVFMITVAFGEAPPAVPSVDTLIGATITRVGRDYSQGPDPLMVSCDLDFMDVKDNGSTPMAGSFGII
jgi:hypothetical protein